jgi:hypothetical protein
MMWNQSVYGLGVKEFGTGALFGYILVPQKAGFSGRCHGKAKIQELSWTQFYNVDPSVPKNVKLRSL